MSRPGTILRGMALFVLLSFVDHAFAQDYGSRIGTRDGGRIEFRPRGPGVLFDALDPLVRRSYLPQELIQEYRWPRNWPTNYAQDHYLRYVDPELEGEYFYDLYGNLVSRGMLLYDWRQAQPRMRGSALIKTYAYAGWFSRLVIAADVKGEYRYALTVGDQIRTTLTPMTFSKPSFNGVQWDLASNTEAVTFLLSRINWPVTGASFGGRPAEGTSVKNLFGGRMTKRISDLVTVGGTYVNAHNGQTSLKLVGDPFKGHLWDVQNRDITFITLRISDDSPEDGMLGAALFWEEILITDLDGNQVLGYDIGFWPTVKGGRMEIVGGAMQAYLGANGTDKIELVYDFEDPSYTGPDPSRIHHVTFRLALARDYKVELTSSGQLDFDVYGNEIGEIYTFVTRAPGNPGDLIDQTLVTFDYGLPTANEIYGFTVEVEDVYGFSLQGELDFNRRYRQYPNRDLKRHHVAVLKSSAWYLDVAYRDYPWLASGEFFSMDPDYSTTADELTAWYEFVDDNDDLDRVPDWPRSGQPNPGGRIFPGDDAVFPGWDENNDGISDFNQNDNPKRWNLIPDYEEPFLRYGVDRPEFLFGMDMNHNGWIDRFENDQYADYPYKKDHRGFNVYLSTHLAPDMRVAAGHLRERLLSSARRNVSTYALFALDRAYSKGRLRFFESLRFVRDTIPDPLLQWMQPMHSRGYRQEIDDPLPGQNTWITTTFAALDACPTDNLNIITKIKGELWHQRESADVLHARYPFQRVRANSGFLGVINKADYTLPLGKIRIQLRGKGEFRREIPYLRNEPDRRELAGTATVMIRFPVLHRTEIQAGAEITRFEQFYEPTPMTLSDDFLSTVLAIQLTNCVAQLGYRVVTQTGARVDRTMFEDGERSATGTGFFTVYVGME